MAMGLCWSCVSRDSWEIWRLLRHNLRGRQRSPRLLFWIFDGRAAQSNFQVFLGSVVLEYREKNDPVLRLTSLLK